MVSLAGHETLMELRNIYSVARSRAFPRDRKFLAKHDQCVLPAHPAYDQLQLHYGHVTENMIRNTAMSEVTRIKVATGRG